MSWFTDLAGKAESLLNNLDEQTGAAIRAHNGKNIRPEKRPSSAHPNSFQQDHDNWSQKPRWTTRSLKRPPMLEVKSLPQAPRKLSPARNSRSLFKDGPAEPLVAKKGRKSPPMRPKPPPMYHLNNSPKTLVDDEKESSLDFSLNSKQRRHSLPSELDFGLFRDEENLPLHIQNLEIENTMLKNELNVMNREVGQMLEKLKSTEDELGKTRNKLEDSQFQSQKSHEEKSSLDYQMKILKEKITEIAKLDQNYREEKYSLYNEISALKDANNYLEERVNQLKQNLDQSTADQHKTEADLRHLQSVIKGLEDELEKSKAENQRLENDWDSYKLRVKSMLFAKDNEIKALQDGVNFSEETKVLVEQLESLKLEREELSEALCTARSECDGMKLCLSQVEGRHLAAERVVAALRDALKEERSARNRAETQYFAASKELKSLQAETGQTIANLRSALRDRETELAHIRESSSIRSSDTSALNVADYDVTQDSIENEKIQYLTETLVQRQAKVDKLMSENNMLKIQLDKLESKYRTELTNRSLGQTQSVVNLHNTDTRTRKINSDSILTMVSHRIAVVIRRHPVIRIFVIIYMICLHFWVLTVLLTSTPPENFVPNYSRT